MQFRRLTAAVFTALALPLHAQDARTLDDVVVTANRAPVPVREVIAPVEVIDRETIERAQARDLTDLLRGRAGISIGNQGGLGKLTSIFVRGAEADQVLVLVDGVRVGSATSGQAALQDLPLEVVERIEIVRGPRSSLYGSEAIGGVIQIFTRRDEDALTPRLAVGAGSHDTYEASAGVGGRIGRGWLSADYARTESEGFDACRGFFNPVTFAGGGCFTNEPDRDGYWRHSLSLRAGADVADGWRVEGHALRAQADNEFDGSFTNRADVVQQVVGGHVAWAPTQAATLRLSAGRNRDESINYARSGAEASDFSTDRDSAALQGDVTLAAGHRLSVGYDWLVDRVASTTRYQAAGRLVRSRDNRALFAQYLGDFGATDLQASARHDDNEQFGSRVTGNLALGIAFGEQWRATVGGGTAFKAPTFNELYFPGFSDPNLRPERSRTIEAGIAWTSGAHSLRLDAFDSDVDDLITFNAVTSRPANIQRARLRGMELSANAQAAGWDLQGSVSRVDARDRTTPGVQRTLPRRARGSARIDADRAFGALRIGATVAAEGERFDDFANRQRLGGYGTLDLRAEYAFAPAWRVQARVANVLDREYESVQYYNQPGRTWFITLRYAPAP